MISRAVARGVLFKTIPAIQENKPTKRQARVKTPSAHHASGFSISVNLSPNPNQTTHAPRPSTPADQSVSWTRALVVTASTLPRSLLSSSHHTIPW